MTGEEEHGIEKNSPLWLKIVSKSKKFKIIIDQIFQTEFRSNSLLFNDFELKWLKLFRDIEKATKYGPDANLEKRDLPSSMRDPVQARSKKVDLESGVGKTKGIWFNTWYILYLWLI